jgi:hypothetical protein
MISGFSPSTKQRWSLPGTSLICGEADGVDAVIKRCQLIVSYGLNFGFKHVLFGQRGMALSPHNTAQRGRTRWPLAHLGAKRHAAE